MSTQKNIPGIISIEFATKESIGTSIFLAKHLQIDPNELIDGGFTDLEFVPGSAGLTETLKTAPAGDYFEIELAFRIAGISPEASEILDNLRAGDLVYRAMDPQDQGYLLFNQYGKIRFEYQLITSPEPSGSRGYQCKVFTKNTTGLIFCI